MAYTVDAASGRIAYELPAAIRAELARLRTQLVSASYSAKDDVLRVRVKPPLVPVLEVLHRRAA